MGLEECQAALDPSTSLLFFSSWAQSAATMAPAVPHGITLGLRDEGMGMGMGMGMDASKAALELAVHSTRLRAFTAAPAAPAASRAPCWPSRVSSLEGCCVS